ncbi:phosphoribosylglycinamide formyltransferase [Bacillus marinisedimentorum]|uniref:phosphoribosylglycinamide formyltransferase n=1 Tax=Bacillus marinisedimentorum TaxID=1821260 RepID=UPI00087242FC|nr:phosphoribosylglycinamide formyltransferase [Bacillus marinisedimentorum]
MMKMALFASGSGTNVQAIIDEARAGRLKGEPVLLVCDKPGAKAVSRAEAAGIPVYEVSPKHFADKAAYESAVLEKLRHHEADWVVLAGYMRLVGSTLLQAYEGRIVNIHPSLLPAFPGLDAIGQAFDEGVKETGVTIHFVDEGMDTGPVIAQEAIAVTAQDTRDSLQKKIQKVEHRLYPETLNKLFQSPEGGEKNGGKTGAGKRIG